MYICESHPNAEVAIGWVDLIPVLSNPSDGKTSHPMENYCFL